ncbi:MAG: HDOD domain-containing protein [Natronospirillum sp.]
MTESDKLPLAVREYLSKHNVRVTVHSKVQARDKIAIEAILLGDQLGKVQVFLPANRLLDLGRVRQQTGRDLQALAPLEQQRLQRQLGLQTLPALDKLIGLETLIDESVKVLPSCLVHSGVRNVMLELNDFAALALDERTRYLALTDEVPNTDLDYELSLFDLDREAIDQSVARFTSKRIQQRLEETLEVPPLPDTAQAIIRLRVDPNADIEKLSRVVARDPSLSAQVISWASSSYYAAPGSVRSVQDAIVRVLGYDLVMNLSLGLALGKSLEMPKDAPEGYTPYWQAAIYTATAVGALQNCIPREFRPSFGLAYLGGLLHNFGYLILAHVFKPQFSSCCRLWEANPHLEPQVIEDHVLGINRDQIAASLLQSWNLPKEVVVAIRHNAVQDYMGPYSDYAQLVNLAVSLLRRAGLLSGPAGRLDPVLFSELHITPEDAKAAIEQVRDAKDELDHLAQRLLNS